MKLGASKKWVYGVIGVGLVGCGLFITPDDCQAMFGGHGGTGAPFDLSHGFVGTYGSDMPPVYEHEDLVSFGFLEVKDCDSGALSQITHSMHVNGKQQILSSNRIDEFQNTIVGRGPLQKIEWVVALANDFGFSSVYRAIYQDDENEVCGCRVFYPELRGEKKRYEA